MIRPLAGLTREIEACLACPRLVAWREACAAKPPRRFAGEDYWTRPVPGFGDPAALHRAGFANQPGSVRRGDGLALHDAYVLAPVRCAPPGNRPTPDEFDRCRPFFGREIALLPDVRVLLALGGLAWASSLRVLGEAGAAVPRPAPAFGHEAEAEINVPGRGPVTLLGSYHVSRQNTNTGRLTPAMLDAVLGRTKGLLATRTLR